MKLFFVSTILFCMVVSAKTYSFSFVGNSTKELAFDPCTIEKLCYFTDFSADAFPWKAETCLNYEEVFKNYSYFEAKNDCKGKIITVIKFQQGKEVSRTEYLINQKKLEPRQK